jgi:hypothetical protein
VTRRRTITASRPERLFRLLFVVALLASQFSLLHHQLDIQHHANGKECSICLASPGLGHALATSFLPPPVQVAAETPFLVPQVCAGSNTPVRLVARSPPASPLHA